MLKPFAISLRSVTNLLSTINESLITHRTSFSFDSLVPESKPVSNSSNPVSASSSKTSSDFSIHHNFTIANRDPKSNPNLAQEFTDRHIFPVRGSLI